MRKLFLPLALALLLSACGSDADDDKDLTPPTISGDGLVANPIDCQQYRRGDVIAFSYHFADDNELGAYNIEVHNNFDHHSHSTSHVECDMEPNKQPRNPWIFNHDYAIPQGSTHYNARVDIPIPADVDPGDYHFMVRVTDQAGWQQLKAMSIKIVE